MGEAGISLPFSDNFGIALHFLDSTKKNPGFGIKPGQMSQFFDEIFDM
jgi:hypothetical protein